MLRAPLGSPSSDMAFGLGDLEQSGVTLEATDYRESATQTQALLVPSGELKS
jgi:hypothetical protein